MTELERNQRYTIDEMWKNLSGRYDSTHLRRLSYKGFEVISASKLGKGFRLYIYRDGHLLKIRDWSWKDDIFLYAKRYIDQCLVGKI